MLSKFSCLGTGKLEINQININDMSVNEAIWRMRTLETMVTLAKHNENKADELLKIANYSLKGDKDDSLSKENFMIHFDNVDIHELNEKGLTQRLLEVEEKIKTMWCKHSYIEVSRVALTGVPF